MEFNKDDVLKTYLSLYEKHVKPFSPDTDISDSNVGFVRFNDAWRGLDPFEKFLIPRLTVKKNTFPKKPSKSLQKNANPDNYVSLRYDPDGKLIESFYPGYHNFYISDNLTISGKSSEDCSAFETLEFVWYEYDESDRIISAQRFLGSGLSGDDFKYWGEFYEYEDSTLKTAWCFNEYQRYPMQMTLELVLRFMPDRIFMPDIYKYSFTKDDDGLSYVCEHFYRKSQTLTHEDKVSKEKLINLKENGLNLVKDL